MPERASALIVRPLAGPDEFELFNRLPYLLNAEIANDLAAGRRRLSWLWVALRGDRVVARAGWWSLAGDDHSGLDRRGQHADGGGLRPRRLPDLRPPGRPDMAVSGRRAGGVRGLIRGVVRVGW